MDTMRRRRPQEIVLHNDDLLTLILLHVPWKKLKVLKCVSRQWHSLITAPHFRNLLVLPLRASGLFIPHPCFVEDENSFVPLDDPDTPSPFIRTLTSAHHGPFDPQRNRILRSCNGLLLYSTYSATDGQNKYYIYNPSTNQLDILPQHPPGTSVHYTGLAFDPLKSLDYKVIAFVYTSRSVGDFHIYSSETGTWRVSVQSFLKAPDMWFDIGVYWHGCIHWLTDLYRTAVSDCLCFNVDEGRVKSFPRPPTGEDWTLRRSWYLGESEDHLHFNVVCSYTTFLSVYEMKSDYSEWFIKYRIDLSPVSNVFPEMTKQEALSIDDGDIYAVSVVSLVRREKFQEDSLLVLQIPGKCIRYNLVDGSFKVLCDFAADLGEENVECWRIGWLKVWEYIETLSCV